MVAGDVEHAEDVAARVEDRRGRAGEKVIGVEEVLVGVHERGHLVDERGADRVGALVRFGPDDARRSATFDARVEEVVVADRVQDRAGGIGQHDHAVRVDDLLVQQFHHRRGMDEQALIALAHQRDVGTGRGIGIGPFATIESKRTTPRMRALDRRQVAFICRHVAPRGGYRRHAVSFLHVVRLWQWRFGRRDLHAATWTR